jgi:geranylgeranyl pyrophosphate synthase
MRSAVRSSKTVWPVEDYWSIERQLVQNVLDEGSLDEGYRRQLLNVLDQWVKPETPNADLEALPILVCIACGGNPRQAVPVCAAWRLLRLGAKLLDDVEDGDVREGLPEIVNFAVGLVFAGQLVLDKLLVEGVSPAHVQHLAQELSRAGLIACGGQHADLGAAGLDPDRWLEIAAAKSGAPMGWAAWAGALVAGAEENVLAGYRDYGSSLGVLLQISDDYSGVWYPDHVGDLVSNRPTLPVAYALSVASASERNQLQVLLDGAQRGDLEADRQARKLLIDVGAQAFMLVVGQVWHDRAAQALQQVGGDHPAKHQLLAALRQVFPALQGHSEG